MKTNLNSTPNFIVNFVVNFVGLALLFSAATTFSQTAARLKSPSGQYLKDAPVVQDAQAELLEKIKTAKENTQDPRSVALLEDVEKAMQKALDLLAKSTNSAKPLPEALAAEQAAYQALLKLSTHEFQVAKGKNQNQKGQGSGAPSQQQLEQLDLKQSDDRYETQSQASAQPSEQREQLQIQSRLKELAQRQHDLNEKLKELQNALQEAKTEEEKEEIRRQLKRLREQEQEMLADVDELRQRMDKPENQSKLAEARQQLEKTRADIQRASEALENQQASQTLSAGTRAQRQLQDIRDDLRKKNSSQFSEEMKQMRSEARQLARNQEDVGKKLEDLAQNKQKRLSDTEERNQLAGDLAKQKSSLTNLLDKMRDVSDKAENSEPLLSKQLYDTLRKSAQNNTEKSLDLSEELMKRSLASEATKFEQKARQEINDLKQGVERAAESVLGDDTEALKLAKKELDKLADEIERDIARAGRGGMLANNSNTNGAAGERSQNGGGNQNADQQEKAANGQQQSGEQSQQGQQGNQNSQNQGGQQNEKTQQGQSGQQQGQQGQNGQGEQNKDQQAKQGQQQGQNGQAQSEQNQQGQQGQRGQQGEQGQNGEQAKQNQQGQQGQQAQNGQQGQKGQQAQQNQQGQQGRGQGQGQQGEPKDQQNQQLAQNQQNQQGQQGQGQGRGEQQQQQNNQQNQQQAQGQGQGRGDGKPDQPQPTDQARQPSNERRDGGAPARGRGSNKPSRANFWETGQSTREHQDGGSTDVLTGDEYGNWSDRLREVEELLDEPALRNEVARVREKARNVRSEFKHQGKAPQWPMVKAEIANPLAEVRNRVGEELARRQSQEALVPIDRDPVPTKFSELVRRYYEKLGNND